MDIVLAGQVLPFEQGNVGHDITRIGNEFRATRCGRLRQIDSIYRLEPLGNTESRVVAESTLVGRIVRVESKGWKVFVNMSRLATLPRASCKSQDEQRRLLSSDFLNMREMFTEKDLVCLTATPGPNSTWLLKPGPKHFTALRNGCMVTIAQELVEVHGQFAWFDLPKARVSVILGLNGMIWVGLPPPCSQSRGPASIVPGIATLRNMTEVHVPLEERQNIIRVRNIILALADQRVVINEKILMQAYDIAVKAELGLSAILNVETSSGLVQSLINLNSC